MVELPTYSELQRNETKPGTAWGIFGDEDELGTLNHLTAERVRGAAGLVRSGEVFNLDLPLDAIRPSLISTRRPLDHQLFQSNDFHRDERIDSFYTQYSSHLDGLRHIGHPEYGFYNGADPAAFTPGEPVLGINRYAERGIVGRGVLVDVDRFLRREGAPLDQDAAVEIPISTVTEAADAQGVSLRAGDILMIRTGWVADHLRRSAAEREAVVSDLRSPGLEASEATVEWLWDSRISVIGMDNVAVEAWPASPDSPFLTEAERSNSEARTRHSGLMHRVLIPLLGLVLGELWALDDLAARCAEDGRWDCLFVASPLNLTGGAGSPLNAVAIR